MAVSVKNKRAMGQKLRQARLHCELSQRKAALAIGISNAALSDIENGINFPSDIVLLNLIELLNPNADLQNAIFKIYAKAKDAPPPDISAFVRDRKDVQELLHDIMARDIPPETLSIIRAKVQKMRVAH